MPESFDTVVIGSSPLMLLVALSEREAGRSVCVLDKSGTVGGMWRTEATSSGIEVEYACHLVEDFPGVYEYLETASGERFVRLDVQPVRILRNGARVRYSSRKTVGLGAVWSCGMILRHWLRSLAGLADDQERERYPVLVQKVRDFVREHLALMVRGSVIKAPVNGYAEFIRALKGRCDSAGIAFRTFDVQTIRADGEKWMSRDSGGAEIAANEVRVTTTANLYRVSEGQFEAYPAPEDQVRSVLVEVRYEAVRERVSYAAFWRDPEVVRVSRIDQRNPHPGGLLYLVQLGRTQVTGEALGEVVVRSLVRSGVVADGDAVTVLDEIQCTRVGHEHELEWGTIAPGFRTHRSAGNLASGIATWLRER